MLTPVELGRQRASWETSELGMLGELARNGSGIGKAGEYQFLGQKEGLLSLCSKILSSQGGS